MSFAKCFAAQCLNVRCEVIDGMGRLSLGSGTDGFLSIWPVIAEVKIGLVSVFLFNLIFADVIIGSKVHVLGSLLVLRAGALGAGGLWRGC